MSCFVFQTISYMAERVVGTGSFGIVFQVIALAIVCFPLCVVDYQPDV